MPSTIFVIDSSPAVRRMVEQISTPEGYDVVGFQDGPAALEAARKMSPDLIITDYHLDNMTFSGFCKEVLKLENLTDTYIIALTGATDKLDESHLKSLGVKAFLKKPFQSDNLLDIIKDLDHSKAAANAKNKKKRSWPPTSSSTDSEDDEDHLDEAAEEVHVLPAILEREGDEGILFRLYAVHQRLARVGIAINHRHCAAFQRELGNVFQANRIHRALIAIDGFVVERDTFAFELGLHNGNERGTIPIDGDRLVNAILK